MSFLKRLFGFYDPGDLFDDIEDDFTDPAEVKKRRGKKNDEQPKRIPWGPIVPSDTALLYEVPRPGQAEPDLITVYDYRRKVWDECGGNPSADIGEIIEGRIRSGAIGFRQWKLDRNGKALQPADQEDTDRAIAKYNKAYADALEKLAEEIAREKERSKKAAAKIAADKEAEDKAPEEVRAELVEGLVSQAKTMTFEQKRDLISMFPSLPEAVRAKIISARPDPPAGDAGSPADPPPAGGDGTT